MKNKNNLIGSLILILGILSPSVHAVMINIAPVNQVVNIGDAVSVDVSISDFDIDQFLGDFEFDMTFNDSILNNAMVTFGSGLGFSDQFDDVSTSGLISLFEVSLESAAFLEDNQPSEFILFSLQFDTIAVGTSVVMLDTVYALGDQFGIAIDDINLSSARITVRDPNAVSEPSTFVLLFGGILALVSRKRSALLR